MIISVSTQNNCKIHQINVNLAFLNGTLEEEVNVEQHTKYVVRGKKDKAYRLVNTLYGLK